MPPSFLSEFANFFHSQRDSNSCLFHMHPCNVNSHLSLNFLWLISTFCMLYAGWYMKPFWAKQMFSEQLCFLETTVLPGNICTSSKQHVLSGNQLLPLVTTNVKSNSVIFLPGFHSVTVLPKISLKRLREPSCNGTEGVQFTMCASLNKIKRSSRVNSWTWGWKNN